MFPRNPETLSIEAPEAIEPKNPRTLKLEGHAVQTSGDALLEPFWPTGQRDRGLRASLGGGGGLRTPKAPSVKPQGSKLSVQK